MAKPKTEDDYERVRELMMYVARKPRICCGCICLSDDDKDRAKRVFKLSRAVSRAWSSAAPA
jgi:hypothetical protein